MQHLENVVELSIISWLNGKSPFAMPLQNIRHPTASKGSKKNAPTTITPITPPIVNHIVLLSFEVAVRHGDFVIVRTKNHTVVAWSTSTHRLANVFLVSLISRFN